MTNTNPEPRLTADDLVRREVHYCVSSLITTLSLSAGYDESHPVNSLAYQAMELASPVLDYEEAAREAGWKQDPEFPESIIVKDDADRSCSGADRWQAACELDNVDPYEWEVYEHWIVSDWLADKLEAKGEKVDRDFAGMTVWARTTTGQAISMDGVIQAIHAELMAA